MASMNDTKPRLPARELKLDAEQDGRVQREAEIIAQAQMDIDAGLGINDDDLEPWLEALEHDEHALLPTPRGIG